MIFLPLYNTSDCAYLPDCAKDGKAGFQLVLPPDMRDDEIGMLSASINELSDKLHEALEELHRRNAGLEDEIQMEKERERRRMLFFSGISHELKTPVAIVAGQLEGMQAGIGVYRDRDKYLKRSAQILQSLNQCSCTVKKQATENKR